MQGLDDQQPSTSRELQSSHHIEHQHSKVQPNVINVLLSSDSESGILQSNDPLVKKPEINKVIKVLIFNELVN